jgi:hypothetical protein
MTGEPLPRPRRRAQRRAKAPGVGSAIDLYPSAVTRKGGFDGIRIEPWGACLRIARYHRDQQV